MLKWIGLAVVVIIGLVVWRITSAYKELASGGDSTMTMIAASPDRVFNALANPDSMTVWMGDDAEVISSRHGLLQVGDTVRVNEGKRTSSRSTVIWTVSEIRPGQLMALTLNNDSTHQAIATQRDSLIANGDSTTIVTTIAVPMMDSIRSTRTDSSSKVGGAMLNFGSKMMIGAFRKLSEIERAKLKTHLEVAPAAAATH